MNVFDSSSLFQVVAVRDGVSDSIVVDKTAGSIAVPSLGPGTWKISVRDAVGNVNDWGKLLVRTVTQTGDRVPGFVATLLPLPQWVSKGCSVVVVRDSGRIASIVSKLDFKTDSDSSRWVAYWTAPADSTTDSVSIIVNGRGTLGGGVIRMGARVGIDRDGPAIEVTSALRGGTLRVGRDGGPLSFTVSDDHGVDTAWIAGNAASVCDSKGYCNLSVKSSVEIHALDTLKNERVVNVSVKRDSLAPVVDSVLGSDGKSYKSGTILPRTTDSGFAHLRVVAHAADSDGVVVRLRNMNDGQVAAAVAAVNGVVDFKDAPVGSWILDVYDSLGNGDPDMGSWVSWGTVTVHAVVQAPLISRPNGVFGADTLLRGTDVLQRPASEGDFDPLPVSVRCPDAAQGALLELRNVDGPWVDMGAASLGYYWGTPAVQFQCVRGSDTSIVVGRSWAMLQRPWISAASDSFTAPTTTVTIVRDTANRYGNPAAAVIEYCQGDASGCPSTSLWINSGKTDSVQVVLSESGTLWARVAYDGKVGYDVSRAFTKGVVGTNWTRNFGLASAPIVTDTAGLRKSYQIQAWSGKTFDTLSVKKTSNPNLRFDMKWQIAGRPTQAWGAFGVDFFLDSAYSVYDFTNVDSITFDYAATGTMLALRLYPIEDGTNNDGVALQYADSGVGIPSSASRHVCVRPDQDLKYPGWTSSATTQKTWGDIKGSIKALSFLVEPKTISGSSGVPDQETTSLTISKVTIYGTIRRK